MTYEGRCVLATSRASGERVEGTILLASSIGNELDDRINRTLGVAALVCPERTGGALSKHCDTRLLGFTLRRTRETCGFEHALDFYRDGLVHYFVHGIAMSDQYFELQSPLMTELVRKAAALPGATLTFPTGRGFGPRNPQYPGVFFYTELTDLEATRDFADEVARVLRMAWQETPATADPAQCDASRGDAGFPRGGTLLPPR